MSGFIVKCIKLYWSGLHWSSSVPVKSAWSHNEVCLDLYYNLFDVYLPNGGAKTGDRDNFVTAMPDTNKIT